MTCIGFQILTWANFKGELHNGFNRVSKKWSRRFYKLIKNFKSNYCNIFLTGGKALSCYIQNAWNELPKLYLDRYLSKSIPKTLPNFHKNIQPASEHLDFLFRNSQAMEKKNLRVIPPNNSVFMIEIQLRQHLMHDFNITFYFLFSFF